MSDFKNKVYDVLVSTTVVEVGVDVPNSTVMVIENAERFGLSQLHQLRGRVGRNDKQSYCVLISSKKTDDTMNRLNVLVQSNDGFYISEKDLEFRGPGEFLGTRQSGLVELHLTDLTKDMEILEQARVEALHFVENVEEDAFSDELKKYLKRSMQMAEKITLSD